MVALSLATDLSTGQPLEHGLRTCRMSLTVAEELGLDVGTRSCVYYFALLRFLGCTSDAAETAQLAGGDDLAFNAAMAPVLMADPGEGTRFFLRHLAEGLPARRRLGRVVAALTDPGAGRRSLAQHCEVGARLASRLGVPDPVVESLAHAYERWDGRGEPTGLRGEEIPAAVRVVSVARDVELWARRAGWPAARTMAGQRRGHAYDPGVVDVVVECGEHALAGLGDDPCAAVLDAEPAPVHRIGAGDVDGALTAMADFADLKSPCMRGHSTEVGRLAAAAAQIAGLSDSAARTVRRAALVHDVGRVGVPNGIWDHPGPLTTRQWEQVRLHPYWTERILRRCALTAPYAEVAARHHERADGSGYHRGIRGDQLDLGARLLAAADAYHAMTEERPHRPALAASAAAAELGAQAAGGRFGRTEVDSVLAAAGQPGHEVRICHPAGLTDREITVLRLIARGRANKQVAAALGISPKTVGRHVEHIYAKTGVTTRAGAALFAMENELLTSPGMG